jgi:hypothetical protein
LLTWSRSYCRERVRKEETVSLRGNDVLTRITHEETTEVALGRNDRFPCPSSRSGAQALRRLAGQPHYSRHPALLPSSRAPPLEARLPARSLAASRRRQGVLLRVQSPATRPPPPSAASQSSSASRRRRRAPAATAEAAAGGRVEGQTEDGKFWYRGVRSPPRARTCTPPRCRLPR